ncbi:Hydroxyacylglutathione hydrolase [Usitatibacter rugosus]|uniref:Hydroxyacylglutathione hydrolase n=1 Tax=Usitatibacter rugosus TaxID=2732067 RepID=A0A6M4H376_9PROT|nr:MBL fold metallo-hydrolase [Usitatibacter rugosus]QJR13014.1 Hydroxyacylglutathione hydrolase [Usitatibacter rugosus]
MNALRLLAIALLAPLAFAASAGRVSNKDYDIVTLADGVHGFVWRDPSAQVIEGNALFIVNERDVIVVDTGLMPASTLRMIEELRKLTPKPVSMVVNTHWHDDHVNGNGLYRDAYPGVLVVAHANTRQDQMEQVIAPRQANLDKGEAGLARYDTWLEKGVDDTGKAIDEARRKRIVEFLATARAEIPLLRSVKDSPADITLDSKLVVERGDRRIEILHLGLGNTRGDLVVFLPKERIVATGDLLVYPIPFMFGSYYDTWPETLEKVAALPADTLFLMHGAPQKDRTYLKQVQALLRDIAARSKVAAATSLSAEEAAKQVDLKDWQARFAGDNTIRQREFEGYVVQPAVTRAIRQARGEPAAFLQNLQ